MTVVHKPRLIGTDPLDEDGRSCAACGNAIRCADGSVICAKKPREARGTIWMEHDPERATCDLWREGK